jgi:molybdopterin converting factor small subunit
VKVTVKLIGPLIYEAGFSEKEIEIGEGATIEALLEAVGLVRPRPKVITRNGRAVVPNESLAEGDRVAVSPIYSGG